MDYKSYDEIVEAKVDIYSVPGTGFDVDGMEDQQGQIEDVTTVLGFMTLVVLSFGVGIGSWYLRRCEKWRSCKRCWTRILAFFSCV